MTTMTISAYFSPDLGRVATEDSAIDAANVSFSPDEWTRLLSLLPIHDQDNHFDIEDVAIKVDNLIEGRVSDLTTPEPTFSDLSFARKMRALISVGRQQGCNLIGIAS